MPYWKSPLKHHKHHENSNKRKKIRKNHTLYVQTASRTLRMHFVWANRRTMCGYKMLHTFNILHRHITLIVARYSLEMCTQNWKHA